jgi:chromate transporter
MIYLNLFLTFFKIGLFSFGGGYGMIPLIEREIVLNGWITGKEFVEIISISEMTPGPIAINTATFIGYKLGGIPGAMLATAGVVIPSLIIILIVFHYFTKFQKYEIVKETICTIKPILLALIIQAVIFVAGNVLLREGKEIKDLLVSFSADKLMEIFNPVTIIITVLSLLVLLLTRLHPIIVILGAGAIGVILHYTGLL